MSVQEDESKLLFCQPLSQSTVWSPNIHFDLPPTHRPHLSTPQKYNPKSSPVTDSGSKISGDVQYTIKSAKHSLLTDAQLTKTTCFLLLLSPHLLDTQYIQWWNRDRINFNKHPIQKEEKWGYICLSLESILPATCSVFWGGAEFIDLIWILFSLRNPLIHTSPWSLALPSGRISI